MSTNLGISIHFLDPVPSFHGRGDGGEPEWPPSPLRVYQALVCAAAARWRPLQFQEYAVPALQWLEAQRPTVIAPPVQASRTPYRTYVPNNAGDLVTAAWARGSMDASIAEHRVEKDVRPSRLANARAIHYLFPLSDGSCPHFETLAAAARSITHLGWGIDMVAANATILPQDTEAKLIGERWKPAASGGTALRVPIEGTLDALMEKHQAFLKRLGPDGFRPVPPLTAFRIVHYRRESDPAPRPFAAFRLLQVETGKLQSFAATDPVRVAGLIRGAAHGVAKRAGREPCWIGEFVCGHHEGADSFARFSYLPLPSLQPHVGVGRIGRVLIAEPMGGGGAEAGWMQRQLTGHTAMSERNGNGAMRDALLVPLPRDDYVLGRYVRPATVWTTATPVALPGSDDGVRSKTVKLLEKMFRHAGYSLDSLAEPPEYQRVPFLRGAEDATRYRPGGGHYLSNCTMYHMRIRWKFPMPGPIALGAGRHCGLGVLVGDEL